MKIGYGGSHESEPEVARVLDLMGWWLRTGRVTYRPLREAHLALWWWLTGPFTRTRARLCERWMWLARWETYCRPKPYEVRMAYADLIMPQLPSEDVAGPPVIDAYREFFITAWGARRFQRSYNRGSFRGSWREDAVVRRRVSEP